MGVFDTLRGKHTDEVIDVDAEDEGAEGAPAQKRPRTSEQSNAAASSNKFTGDDVLARVPTSAQQGGGLRTTLPTLPPSGFYGGAVSAVGSAVRAVTSWTGAAAAKPTHAAPSRTNVAGDSRLVPLQIDDGDDRGKVYQRKAKASAAALPDWLVGPPPAPPSETVVVQSNRAWIGDLAVQSCRLDFTNDKVSLWARCFGGDEIYYSELLCEGVVTKWLSGYQRTDESMWPPDFCGVVALETCDWPGEECKDCFDPYSANCQRRALCCLFLDNHEWTAQQREILLFPAWAKRWDRLSLDDQYDLMIGRRGDSVARAKQSNRQKVRARRHAAPQLQAPLLYPPADADAVTVTNADLLRLEVSEFLNDSLVDFALKRLQGQLAQEMTPAEYERKFHFFNCFFFKKLLTEESTMRRKPDYADDAYARVQKWTALIDLFSKDFIVVPVNQSLHWSLVIACHLGEAERLLDDSAVMDADADVIDVDAEPAVAKKGPTPIILHLNSMSGTHANVENLMREYLAREWDARRGHSLKRGEALFGKDGPVAFCRASVPQQDNYYDCGVFLIEFARRFCLNPPAPYLSMRAADGWPYMLRPSWFQPTDAGESNRDALRAEILSLGECVKPEQAAVKPENAAAGGAGRAAGRAAATVVSLVDTDDDDEVAPLAALRKPVAAAAVARAASPPLQLSDESS